MHKKTKRERLKSLKIRRILKENFIFRLLFLMSLWVAIHLTALLIAEPTFSSGHMSRNSTNKKKRGENKIVEITGSVSQYYNFNTEVYLEVY